MQDLKSLNLTSDDFKLLIEGLDALPERGTIGEFMSDVIMSSLIKDDSEAKNKMEEERNKRKEKQLIEKNIMKENIRILQGKLLMFKRYLQDNNLLNLLN
jgi:hypothetical protein